MGFTFSIFYQRPAFTRFQRLMTVSPASQGRPQVLQILCDDVREEAGNKYSLMGVYGAAVATAAVYVLEACAIIILARKLFGIRM